ncbi:MAG TPA: GNAT family N-acetyltransferase [Chloroflexota bacterium]|nr:GNAT family N-acetyltransferase [Chloroflexota bacterium]
MGWEVVRDAEDGPAYEVLARDRVWNCFGIADLEPPFRQDTTVSFARDGDQVASLTVLDRSDLRVISPFGDRDGVRTLLAQLWLPDDAFCQIQHVHLQALDGLFQPLGDWQEMVRMNVTPETSAPVQRDPRIEQLDQHDRDELRGFYGPLARGPFPDLQLIHGLFFGIRTDGRLASAAGTHVMTCRYGIAVVGGVLTRPDQRGQGLAASLVAHLTRALFDRGCHDVALNVAVDNAVALRLYERLGFREHMRFASAPVQRVRASSVLEP